MGEGRTDVRVERTRECVLAAARRLIESEGVAAVTPQRITDETGVSRSTVHRHWPDTRQLLFDALAAVEPADDLPVMGDLRLDLAVDLHQLRLKLNDPKRLAVIVSLLSQAVFDAEFADVLRSHARHHLQHLERVIRSGQQAGALRADIDLEAAAAALAGPLFYRRMVVGHEITPEFVDTIVDQFIAAHAPAN